MNSIKKDNKFDNKNTCILISGYYGFGNIGDEAILSSIVYNFRKIDQNIDLVVLSAYPAVTTNYLGVKSIQRTNLWEIIKQLKKTDLFISGGGGLMQDITGPSSVIYYGGLLYLAYFMKVKTVVFAQGIGPLKRKFNKFLVKKIFSKVSIINVRDLSSKKDLVHLGLKKNINVTADPALLLNSSNVDIVNDIILKTGLDPKKKILGIALRPWFSWFERQLKSFTSVIFQFAQKYDLQILLIPFHRQTDLWLAEEAYNCLVSRPDFGVKIKTLYEICTPEEINGVIRDMHIVVGMRLHSLILAGANSVPSIGIAYDPKVTAFCEQFDFPCVESVDALQNPKILTSFLDQTIANRENKAFELKNKAKYFKTESYKNWESSYSLLPNT